MATVQKRSLVKVVRDGKVRYEDHSVRNLNLLRDLARRRGAQVEVDFTYTKHTR